MSAWVEQVRELERALGRLEGQRELTEQTASTLRESLERERDRADRLEAELQAERTKGFWARLFGG
jgi:chromosome segregation ATPase